MKKKLFAILCATAVTFGLLTGCGGSQPAATQAAAPAAETTAAAAAANSTGNTEGRIKCLRQIFNGGCPH